MVWTAGEPSGSNGGDCGGHCVHHNRCLRVKAAFAGSAKSPANTGFATRVAITVAAARGGWGAGGMVKRADFVLIRTVLRVKEGS